MKNGPSTNPSLAGMGKKIAWASGGVLLLFVIIFSLVPTILSTQWGKKQLEEKIGSALHSSLTIDDLSLSWLGHQTAKGIRLKDEKGEMAFFSPSFTGGNPLWKVLFLGDLGECQLESPEYTLKNSISLTSSLKLPSSGVLKSGFLPEVILSSAQSSSPWAGYHGQLTITQGKIEVLSPQLDPITFSDISMLASRPKSEDHVEIELQCSTVQQQIQGKLSLKATVSNLNASIPTLLAQASVVQLPVRGIDQIASQFYPPLSGLLLDLIGPTIDMKIDINSAQDAFQLSLDTNSPQFTAHLSTHGFDGIVSLKTPGLIKLTMPPKSFAKFSQLIPTLRGIVLTQPATFLLNVTELSMDMPKQLDDFKSLKMEATFTSSPSSTWEFQDQTFTLQNAQAQFSTPKLSEGLTMQGALNATTANQPIQLSYQAQFSELFGESLKGKGTIRVQQLPLAMAQQFAGLSFPLAQWIGPSLNASIAFDLQEVGRSLEISAHTAYLDIPSLNFSLDKGLRLLKPAQINYTLTPQAFPEGPFQVVQQATLQSTLQEWTLPSFDRFDQVQLALHTQTDRLPFNGLPLEHFSMDLRADTLDQISLTIDSDRAKFNLLAGVNLQKKVLTLTTPLQGEVIIDNAMYQAWAPRRAMLAQNAILSLSIEPFSLPLDPAQSQAIKVKGVMGVPLFALANVDRTKSISLAAMQVPFQFDTKNKTVDLQLSSQVEMNNSPSGSLNLSAALTHLIFAPHFDLSQAKIETKGNLANIPTALFDTFAITSHATTLLGPTINCSFKADSTPDLQSFTIQASSALLNLNAAFTADRQALQLQGNQGQASWTLTPESYPIIDSIFTGQLSSQSPFILKGASTFNLNFSSLYVPLQLPSSTGSLLDRFPLVAKDLSQLKIVVQGKNPSLNFFDNSSQEEIQLANSSFSLNKGQRESPIQFNLSAAVTSQAASAIKSGLGKSGSLNINSTIHQMLNDQGQFDLATLSGKFLLNLSQFPSRVLDIVARTQGKTHFPFSTIFGETISADADADLNGLTGPLSLSLNSPNSRFSLKGKLQKGALILEQPLHAQGTVTAEISHLFLKEVNPLSISYIYSQAPITLEVSPADFYLPLYPYDPARVNISQARIELGQIYCRNEGNINTALALLKSKQFAKDREMMLWFAPIDLHITQGIVDIERTEVLIANTFDIAIWGKFNMPKSYIDMLLGLPAPTLQKAFGIKGLPENYVLTIPMKGPSSNVQIDTGKATAKVALLLAWQQSSLAGAAAGGPAGAIVGGLLGKLATLPDKDAKVPSAKHPFPWESGKAASRKSSSQVEGKKRHFKGREKPLKQILKVIR